MAGPTKPNDVLKFFISSEGHCDQLLNPYLNAVGAYLHLNLNRNVFVVNFAYINDLSGNETHHTKVPTSTYKNTTPMIMLYSGLFLLGMVSFIAIIVVILAKCTS